MATKKVLKNAAKRRQPPSQAVVTTTTPTQLLDFAQLEAEYGTPKQSTSYSWACTNRHGFRALVLKVGSRSMVRRADFEAWLDSRKLGGTK